MVKLPLLPVPAEDPANGFGLRLMSLIWGYPFIDGTTPGPQQSVVGLFRWDPPRSLEDAKQGRIGANTLMWHAPYGLQMTEDGPDGKDWAGSYPESGIYEEDDLWRD